jgi:hypothetical protein
MLAGKFDFRASTVSLLSGATLGGQPTGLAPSAAPLPMLAVCAAHYPSTTATAPTPALARFWRRAFTPPPPLSPG